MIHNIMIMKLVQYVYHHLFVNIHQMIFSSKVIHVINSIRMSLLHLIYLLSLNLRSSVFVCLNWLMSHEILFVCEKKRCTLHIKFDFWYRWSIFALRSRLEILLTSNDNDDSIHSHKESTFFLKSKSRELERFRSIHLLNHCRERKLEHNFQR